MSQTFDKKVNYGFHLTYPAPGIVERVAQAWDWFWIDSQHGEIQSYDALAHITRTCQAMHCKPVIRIADNTCYHINQALGLSPSGIIIPQIDNLHDAREVVLHSNFPPHGNRSYGDRRPIDLHGREYWKQQSDRPLIIAQIESVESLKNIDQIATVPQIDALFFGPDDYCMSRFNEPMSLNYLDEIAQAMDILSAACHQHQKQLFAIGSSPQLHELALKSCAQWIVGTSDSGLLSTGSLSKKKELEQSTAKLPAESTSAQGTLY